MKLSEYLKLSGETPEEYQARKKRESEGKTTRRDYIAKTRVELATTDISDIYESLTKGGYIDPETLSSYGSRLDDYIKKYSYINKYTNSGKSEYLDSLNRLRSGVSDYYDVISKYANEDEYNYSVNTQKEGAEGVEARKKWYEDLNKKIEELNKEIPWYGKTPVIGDVFIGEDTEGKKDKLEELKALKNQYERNQKVTDDYYQPITPEFEQNAAFRDYNNPTKDELWGYDLNQQDISVQMANGGWYDGEYYRDAKGNIINKIEKPVIEDKLGLYLSASSEDKTTAYSELRATNGNYRNTWASLIQEGDTHGWDYLEESEIDIYYDLLKREGQEAAYKFLSDMETELGIRENEKIQEEISGANALQKIAYNIASVPMNVLGGIPGFIDDASQIIQGEEINPYSRAHFLSNTAGIIRNDTSDIINNATGNASLPWIGTTFGDVYQSIMSGADTLFGSAFGSTGYGIMMGLNSATSEAKKLYEQGASTAQIAAGGILSGAAEMIFEKMSLEYFFKNFLGAPAKSKVQLVMKILAQGGIEASEEVATEIANTITNAAVMGSQSDIQKYIDNYISQGYSKGEATVKALFSDIAPNVLNAGIGGFISGGAIGGAGAVINYNKYNKYLKENGEGIIEMGGVDALQELAIETAKENKNNKKLERLVDKVGEKPTAKNVGLLDEEVDRYRTKNNQKSIENSVIEQMVKDGVKLKDAKKKAGKIAEILFKKYNDEEVDISEALKDESVKKVYDNVIKNSDSEISRRDEHHAEVRGGIVRDYVNGKIARASVDKALSEKFSNTDDGKTINKKTGVEITLAANYVVYANKDGTLILKLENGDTINATDVRFSSNEEAVLYATIADMGVAPHIANSMLNGVAGTDSKKMISVALGLRDAYWYGSKGINYNELENGIFTSKLTEQQRREAYEFGKSDASNSASKMTAPTKVNPSNNYAGEYKVTDGKVDGIRYRDLNNMQKSGLTLAKILSKLGANVYVYMSTLEQRKNHKENGYYKSADGSIHIDLNSGTVNGEGLVAYTVSHEFTHFIEEWSSEKFKKYADILFEELGIDGKSVTSMIEAELNRLKSKEEYKELGYKKLRELAYSEVVAKCSEKLFTDTDVLQKIADRLAVTDRSLLQKIVDFFKIIIDRLRGDYEGQISNSYMGDIAIDTIKRVEAIRDIFADAAVDALKNYRNATVDITSSEAKKAVDTEASEKQAQKVRYMARESLAEAAEKLETISDDEYQRDKQNYPFVLVMEHTPEKILNSMPGGKDRRILIRRDALYLAIRENGVQEGHYHALGSDVLKKLPEYLESPDVILSTIDKNTGEESKTRRIVLSHINGANGQGLVSVEFDSIKDFEGSNEYFNIIVTVFDLHKNYLERLFKKQGAVIKEQKESLAQLNPQLYEWLRTINAKLSGNSIPKENGIVNTSVKKSERMSQERDKEYLDAVNRGDMETAQRLVNEAAEAAGYTVDFSWKMQHTAPNSKEDVSLADLRESSLVPDDYWEHPEWYTYSSEERESYNKVKTAIETLERRKAEGKTADARIWVYRAVDKTVNTKEDYFRNGDWVTPSYDYAVNEGKMNPNGYRIIKHSVSIKNLYWDGNSIAELGFDDGNNYAYADTLNNRKLLDAVTYDENGNIIPLSKRFKKKNSDIRYSLREGAEYTRPITNSDIQKIRDVSAAHGGKRVSINEFTSEDIQATQKWAYKFYQELGTKSPFFRAWFGDWRAHDQSKINTVTVNNIDLEDVVMQSGDYSNEDTGWSIHAGSLLYGDTMSHARGEKISVKSLNDIENILENAVLLNTEISEQNTNKKSSGTAFMHKLYCPITYRGEIFIAKVTVEEYLNAEDGKVKRRGYNLRAIKIEAVNGSLTDTRSATAPVVESASIDSISDLHALVKRYDKEFSPKPVNPVLLNEDGTPKVYYHGTSSRFTSFDIGEVSHLEGSFFFAENREDAAAYGNQVMEVYLTADNLADYDNQPSEFYKLHNKRAQVEYLKKRGYDGWYADIDSGGWGEVSVFSPTQVKSATDNIGTFDSKNPDIRYSDRYTYDELVSKPDMRITVLDTTIPTNRADVIALAKKNAARIGNFNAKEGSVSVHVDDIDTDVVLSKAGLIHSLDRRLTQNAAVTIKAGEILANSIVINELTPKNEKAAESYVLIGVAQDKFGDLKIVESVVNRFKNELLSMDVLYSMNAKPSNKKGTAALNAPSVFNPNYRSTISIAQLFESVNRYFPDILPEDVLRHFGYSERPNGKIGKSALYSDREDVSTRTLLANALESAAQTDMEKEKLKQYKTKIGLMDQEENRLSEIKAKIKELSFAKGQRDTEKISKLKTSAKEIERRINNYDKQLFNLEASDPLKKVLKREKEKAKRAAENRYTDSLKEYKKKTAEAVRTIIQKNQESRKKAIEGRNKTEVRNKVKSIVAELNKYLKENKVLIGMQKVVAEALDAINMDSVGADERVAKYDDLISKATDPEVIEELKKTRDRIAKQGENLKEKLERLKVAYDDIINSDDPLIAGSHDEIIEKKIDAVIQKVGDTSIRDMTLEQLEAVYDMYKMILTSIRQANKAFKMDKAQTIDWYASEVMTQVEAIGKQKISPKVINYIKRKFVWDNLKPIYLMRIIGSDTFMELYRNIRDGQFVWYNDFLNAKIFMNGLQRRYGFNDWDFEKKYTFTSKSGKTFNMTLEQIMSLYAYSRRDQAIKHLTDGGIVFDSEIEVKEKKLGIPVKYSINDKSAYKLSEETIANIIGTLTDNQKAYVIEMQSYLSDVMAEKGNEVSRAMYGVNIFNEKIYFPLQSSDQFLYTENEVKGEAKIKNIGFTHETVSNANNPIVMKNFTDIWLSHCNDMSMYHAFTLPLEDFNRVWNFRAKTEAEDVSVKTTLATAFGDSANESIKKLLTDLNGGVRVMDAGILDKMIGRAKKGYVFASASVTIQQPSSICRAMAYIDPKYFMGTTPKQFNFKMHRATWEECKKYAPIAGIKEMGYFDIGIGRSSIEWAKSQEYEGFNDKLQAFFKDGSYRDEILSKAPALADEITWCHIWNATKAWVEETTDLTGEELLQEAGKRFTDVIDLTQVYDSVLSRSANMRNKNSLMKMVTSFMGERTTVFNMMIDAIVYCKRTGGKQGAKFLARVTGSVLGSVVLNALLKSIVVAWRHSADDDDKTYIERYGKSALEDLLNGLNPFTYIPIANDIVSIFQGYSIERMDMELIEDLVNSLKAITSENKSPYQKVTAIIGAVSQLLGIPLKNVEKDLRPIIKKIIEALK